MRRLLLLLLAAAACAQHDLPARLERLAERLEQARVQHDVPGLALAVVHGDSLLFARGFGFADIEAAQPVTPTTQFCIGSTTKAFTAALLAMLVDEDRLRWDDPAVLYLPELRLRADRNAWWMHELRGDAFRFTVRDLLCHRSGYTRLGVLWAGGDRQPAEIIAAARRARPFGRYGEDFLYNNVMFLAAGMAAARAAGAEDWHALLRERLLEPLGMEASRSVIAEAVADPRFATGYRLDAEKTLEPVPVRDITAIGPAGSITSDVLDMARWLRLQLAGGSIDGTRLVSAEELEETRTEQLAVGGGVGYGLGWMLRSWEGRKVVEHGGNIDGFAAQVALLPEEDLGFVLLTNTSFTPLQSASIDLVFATLLAEEEPASGLSQAELDALCGRYAAGFLGEDSWLTVEARDGTLHLDVPGQMLYELKPPDEEGRWAFAIAPDAIQVAFERDAEGELVALHLYQAGFDFECLREGHEPPVEIPLAELAPYLGRYRDEAGTVLTVKIAHRRLALDVPGQMVYELFPPDADGRWAFRVRPDTFQLRFERDEAGAVVAVVVLQDGAANRAARVAAAEEDPLPSLDEALALLRRGLGGLAPEEVPALEMRGEVHFVHQGVVGSLLVHSEGLTKHAEHMDLGDFGSIHAACDGERAWSLSSFAPFEELEGRALAQAVAGHPLAGLGDLRVRFPGSQVIGRDEVRGRPVVLLELAGPDLPSRTLAVDLETGRVLRERAVEVAAGFGEIPVTIEYEDYREVAGVVLPFRATTRNQHSGATVLSLFSVERREALPAGTFTLEAPAAAD